MMDKVPKKLCSFGSKEDESCSSREFKSLADFDLQVQYLIKIRSGISVEPNHTICERHENKFIKMFELHQRKCCDPFRKNKKPISVGLSLVAIEDHEHWKTHGYHIIPGTKLCKTCRKNLKIEVERKIDDVDDDGNTSQDEYRPKGIDNAIFIDDSLTELGISPIKKHGASSKHKESQVKRKLEKAEANLKCFKNNIFPDKSSTAENSKQINEKAEFYDEMVSCMKEKINTSDKRTIIQILTLAPSSMRVSKVMSTFEVSEYQAKKSKKLFQDKGILALPPVYKGKDLTQNVLDIVADFYENNEYSRSMPGKKDFVSIKKNVHKQKRLILSNLKELHQSFESKHPDITIGYSKFCSLRPKWCILPGHSGTHSVCVCTYHQNSKLLVEALGSKITYKDLMSKLVCSTENKDCMLGRCDSCPSQEVLKKFLKDFFGDYDEDH